MISDERIGQLREGYLRAYFIRTVTLILGLLIGLGVPYLAHMHLVEDLGDQGWDAIICGVLLILVSYIAHLTTRRYAKHLQQHGIEI